MIRSGPVPLEEDSDEKEKYMGRDQLWGVSGESRRLGALVLGSCKVDMSPLGWLEDFNTPLTSMDRSSRQEINKPTVVLHDTTGQLDLTDIYRKFHPKTAKYIFFSSTHGTFSRIDKVSTK